MGGLIGTLSNRNKYLRSVFLPKVFFTNFKKELLISKVLNNFVSSEGNLAQWVKIFSINLNFIDLWTAKRGQKWQKKS